MKDSETRLLDKVLTLVQEREEREGASFVLDYLIDDLVAYRAERSTFVGLPGVEARKTCSEINDY